MDILNFISWIRGKRVVTSVNASETLMPLGLKDPKRDDGYLAGAITVADFASGLVPPAPNLYDDQGNVFIGEDAFNNITASSKQSNIAIGRYTLNFVTESGNVGIGEQALQFTSTGFSNISIGSSSMVFNTTGENNVALGSAPMLFNTTGKNNVAIGSIALFNNTTGRDNVAIGVNCLGGNTTGQNNCALGSEIDNGNYSGSVLLGRQAQCTGNNQFVVGSPGYPAGSVTTESNTSSQVWNVRINGVNRKILLA